MRMPKVSGAQWQALFTDENVKVFQDANDDIFFKVVITGKKPKYFYNETVWSDVPRYCADEMGIKYWDVLD